MLLLGCPWNAQIHYDAVPFAGTKEIQIIKLVCRGGRPPRLEAPLLSDEAWKLMQDCWVKEKEARPTIEDVVERMMVWQMSRAYTRPFRGQYPGRYDLYRRGFYGSWPTGSTRMSFCDHRSEGTALK